MSLVGERPSKRARLLDDSTGSDSSSDNDQAEGVKVDIVLPVNEDYAKRFEHKKKREELQRLEEKYGKDSASDGVASNGSGSESSSSSDDDDEGELATEEVDAQISATLQAIRSKDPRVYDKSVRFYQPEDATNGNATDTKARKEKPFTLHEYQKQNLLLSGNTERRPERTYAEEQEMMKRNLASEIEAAGEDDGADDEDGFLVAKPRPLSTEREPKREIPDINLADRDPDAFLDSLMASRAWVPDSDTKLHPFESDEEEDDERAEEFEFAYNMRFEDPQRANEKLMSHSREAASKHSVRREERKGRKAARDREGALKKAAKDEQAEEKARLRRLKIEDAQRKLRSFKEAAGFDSTSVPIEEWSKFLESGWDGEKWDKEMARRFGDTYYEAREEGGSGVEERKQAKKPKWDDDIDIGDIVPEFDEEEERQRSHLRLSDDDEEEQATVAKNRSEKKRQARKERQKIEQLVDQTMLEEEIPQGETQGPFRYRDTSPQTFGLDARDILMANDSQLNEYAGLKKLATFRDEMKKEKDRRKLGKKARLRKWRQETFGNEEGPPGSFADFFRDKPEVAAVERSEGVAEDDGGRTKKKKRRSRKHKARAKDK